MCLQDFPVWRRIVFETLKCDTQLMNVGSPRMEGIDNMILGKNELICISLRWWLTSGWMVNQRLSIIAWWTRQRSIPLSREFIRLESIFLGPSEIFTRLNTSPSDSVKGSVILLTKSRVSHYHTVYEYWEHWVKMDSLWHNTEEEIYAVLRNNQNLLVGYMSIMVPQQPCTQDSLCHDAPTVP